MSRIHCRHFSGYKPCGKSAVCDHTCPHLDEPQQRLLIVHLEAMGAVLRSTSLLRAVKRQFPSSHITWVTKSLSKPLLENNPLIDRILTLSTDDMLELSVLSFDVAFCIDKSRVAVGVVQRAHGVGNIRGFTADDVSGAIIPANSQADELWQLGLSNEKKFFENKKPETQLCAEALGLDYQRDAYEYHLTAEEQAEVLRRRQHWLGGVDFVIGINTGCSSVIPYKKLSHEGTRQLVLKLRKFKNARIALLGGPEDRLRNQQISHGLPVLLTPTDRGVRDGFVSMAACDVVISGDSLGMHMAIALEKQVVAWFGPTCAHEIDLFDRGEKIQTKAPCSPCWRRLCEKTPMCYDQVDLDAMVAAVERALQGVQKKESTWQTSSSKRPSSGTPSSPHL